MQLAYNFNPAVAVEGMVAEMREANVIISKLAQGAVLVGKLCAPGTSSEVGMNTSGPDPQSASPGQVIALPLGIIDNPMLDFEWTGVPLYDASRPPFDVTNAFSDKDPCMVMRRGVVWVKPEVAFATEKFAVFVRVSAAGPFGTLGAFANAAGAGLVAFPRGRWVTGTNTSSGLAILELQ